MTTAMRKGPVELFLETASVATGQSVDRGVPVVVDANGAATPATASSTKATHVAYSTEDGNWPATAGDKIGVVKIGSPVWIPILVGTGGATCGEYGVATTDGVTDEAVGGGTTLIVPICEFRETSATAGTFVSGWLGVSRTVS